MRKNVAIVGMPSCMGGNKMGCELGPKALRDALFPLLEKNNIRFRDYGNVTEPCICESRRSRAKCLREIMDLHDRATRFFQDNNIFAPKNFPLLLGGDHSVNYPFIKEAASHKKIGLIWFDAHGDFNTPDISPSGNIHGMVLSALAGKGLNKDFGDDKAIVREQNISLVGLRNIDPRESKLLKQTKVNVYTMKEIGERGLKEVLKDAMKAAAKGTKGVHVSFDMDVFDPSAAPDVSTPVPGGLQKKDIKTIVDALKKQKLVSIDAVELNPTAQRTHETAAPYRAELPVSTSSSEISKTAQLAAELIVGLLK